MARGVVHVHSNRSDGSGTIDEIAAAASRAGLQFVVVTDHGDGTRPVLAPAYRHGVLVIDGVEISTTHGHYLGLGLGQTPYRLAGDAADVVEDVRRLRRVRRRGAPRFAEDGAGLARLAGAGRRPRVVQPRLRVARRCVGAAGARADLLSAPAGALAGAPRGRRRRRAAALGGAGGRAPRDRRSPPSTPTRGWAAKAASMAPGSTCARRATRRSSRPRR